MAPRREFLAACGALALAVPPVATADDPHLEWERQCSALVAQMRALPAGEDAAHDALWNRWVATLDRACLTPARTPAGIAAQVRLILREIEDENVPSDSEEEGLRNAVRSLTALAGLADDGLETPAHPVSAFVPAADPHHAWRSQERRIHAAMEAAFAAGDEKLADRLNGQRWEYRNRIIETPAATPQGLGLRVRLIAEMEEEGLALGPDCFAVLRGVADDLDRMGGRV